MQSEFNALFRGARENIDVPALPLTAIRLAAQSEPTPQPQKRRNTLLAILLAGASIATVAAGAKVLSTTHVTFGPSRGVELSADDIRFKKAPSPSDIDSVVRNAEFPVTLPAGLPAGTRLEAIGKIGTGAIAMVYDLPGAWRSSNHILFIVLANPESVGSNATKANRRYSLLVEAKTTQAAHWTIGGEAVLVSSNTITPSELANIERAMRTHTGNQKQR